MEGWLVELFDAMAGLNTATEGWLVELFDTMAGLNTATVGLAG